MTHFKIGDCVGVLATTSARKGKVGTVAGIVPNITSDEKFQSYAVEFETGDLEHYLQDELYIPVPHMIAVSDCDPNVAH